MSHPPLTKARAELLSYLLNGSAAALESDLITWLETTPPFEHFLAAHRDKVRKKLRTATDSDALLDVRAELLVARLLVSDRRMEVAFEAYGSGKTGPDLTVTFCANQRFNVEGTRLRPALDNAEARLRSALLVKPRQLPTGIANTLALVSPAPLPSEAIAAAARYLKRLADKKDEATFTRRGYESARDYLSRVTRLSAVFVIPETGGARTLWPNPEARYPLPREVVTALARSLDPP